MEYVQKECNPMESWNKSYAMVCECVYAFLGVILAAFDISYWCDFSVKQILDLLSIHFRCEFLLFLLCWLFYCWQTNTRYRDSMILFTWENSFYNVNTFLNLYIYLQIRGMVINVKVWRLSLLGKGRGISLTLSPPFSLMSGIFMKYI